MECEAVEFMLYLRRNVTELKKLGTEWGMTQDEISACIDKALENETDLPQDQDDRLKPREIWLKFCQGLKFAFKVIGIIAAVLLGAVLLVSYHEPTGNFFGKVLQPYGYPIFRMIRLATLPLHDYMNITSYYDSECLMDNPFYREPTQECDLCQDTQEVELLKHGPTMVAWVKRLSSQQRPFLFKPEQKPSVQFEDLVNMYNKNKDVLDKSVSRFHSSSAEPHDLPSLFAIGTNDNLMKKRRVSVQWACRNIACSQVLRKMFPRPEFVPPESEVALEKTVYIDSPESHTIEIVGGFFQAVYLSMVKGSRKVVLTSVEDCAQICSPLHIDLQEGDILTFGPAMWRVNVMPNNKESSIMFVGSFTA